MKALQAIAITAILFLVVFMLGCSSGTSPSTTTNTVSGSPQNIQNNSAPAGNRPQFNRSMNPRNGNFSRNRQFGNGTINASMQQRFQEMQQQAIAACRGKSEGDTCQTQSPRGGETEGTCNTRNGQLSCRTNFPTRAT